MTFPTATVTPGTGLTINTLPNAGQTTAANSLPVVLASDQALALPTGASTAANQATGNTALATINTTLGTPMQATGGSVTANAGTNLNTSALALETGGNLAAILTKLGATVLAAGSALIGKVGIDQTSPGVTNAVTAGDNKHLNTTTLTRIANTTAYAGTAASPQAIGLFTSGTVVAPMTLAVSANNNVDGFITSMRLTKSTTGAVGASFVVYVYAAAPTLTSVFDTTGYTPKLADIVASPTKFIGAWFFSNQTINGDNSTYDGLSSSNNSLQAFNLTDGTLRFVLATTGAYVPGSGETFTLTVDMTTNVQ
jgi:hypothetical protein